MKTCNKFKTSGPLLLCWVTSIPGFANDRWEIGVAASLLPPFRRRSTALRVTDRSELRGIHSGKSVARQHDKNQPLPDPCNVSSRDQLTFEKITFLFSDLIHYFLQPSRALGPLAIGIRVVDPPRVTTGKVNVVNARTRRRYPVGDQSGRSYRELGIKAAEVRVSAVASFSPKCVASDILVPIKSTQTFVRVTLQKCRLRAVKASGSSARQTFNARYVTNGLSRCTHEGHPTLTRHDTASCEPRSYRL